MARDQSAFANQLVKDIDHVHLLLSVPPNLAPSRVLQAIKGKTSHHLLMDRRRLRESFWGRQL